MTQSDEARLDRMIEDLVWAIDHFTREDDRQATEARRILKAARNHLEQMHRRRSTDSEEQHRRRTTDSK